MADTFSFPLTPQQFAAKKDQLRQNGVAVPDDNAGEIISQGVTVDYSYDGQTLSLTIKDKPFFYPDILVEGRIREWFSAA